MNLFLTLGLMFALGILGGVLLEKIKVPKIVWYLVLGLLLGPSVLNLADPGLLEVSSILRQIALVIILTRSGLSLDFAVLRKIGRPAILLCFLPACLEMAGIALFAPMILPISFPEALLLGSVLAAVSPAIVVPRMIAWQKDGYGEEHRFPAAIMAGASCDDVFVIVLFYAFKGFVATGIAPDVFDILQVPLGIVLGIAVGIGLGFLFSFLLKKTHFPNPVNIALLLGASFLLVGLEALLKPYVSFSSLLAILSSSIVLSTRRKEEAVKIEEGYKGLWTGFELLLFALVGMACDAGRLFSQEGALLVGVLFIGLSFRSFGVFLCFLGTPFTKKERLLAILCYLPKATVQASIGGIALAEGLPVGGLILTAAVVSILLSAPMGAWSMDLSYRHLLSLPSSREDKAPR